MLRRIGSLLVVLAVVLGVAQAQVKKDEGKKDDGKKDVAVVRVQLPAHYKKLGLRDDQLKKVYAVRGEYKAKQDDLKRQADKLQADEKEALEKLLTAEQLKRLRELRAGEKLKD